MPYLYPYNAASDSAKKLSEALGFKRIKTEGSKFKGSNDKVVINWGCSNLPEEVRKCQVINKPEAVAICADKLKFFNHISLWNEEAYQKGTHRQDAVFIPEYTIDQNLALRWVQSGHTVVARTILNGHSGEGIVLIDGDTDVDNPTRRIVKAPLYTVYKKKKSEYRVHVVGGEAKDVVRKARRQDVPDDQINWKIRNHANGFVFSRNQALGEVPAKVLQQAVNAVKACGLDFGAVDIIYNDANKQVYVLEINTAPGMEGETVDIYARVFREYLNGNQFGIAPWEMVDFGRNANPPLPRVPQG